MFFKKLMILKAKLRYRGNDIIDFGMGNPDMPTPFLYRKLQAVNKPGLEDIQPVEEY